MSAMTPEEETYFTALTLKETVYKINGQKRSIDCKSYNICIAALNDTERTWKEFIAGVKLFASNGAPATLAWTRKVYARYIEVAELYSELRAQRFDVLRESFFAIVAIRRVLKEIKSQRTENGFPVITLPLEDPRTTRKKLRYAFNHARIYDVDFFATKVYGSCTLCGVSKVFNPVSCPSCHQFIGCRDCAHRWIVHNQALSGASTGSCPFCRAEWKRFTDVEQLANPVKKETIIEEKPRFLRKDRNKYAESKSRKCERVKNNPKHGFFSKKFR